MLFLLGRETARLCAGLAGALIFAAALAALAVPGAGAGAGALVHAFGTSLWDALSLDFGASTTSRAAAFADIGPALGESAALLAPGLAIAFLLGVPLGVFLTDRTAQILVVPFVHLARAVPVFCGALALGVIAAMLIPGTVPGSGPSLGEAFAARDADAALAALVSLAPLVLPVGLAGAGVIAAALSGALGDALREPYREELRRLGVGEGEILRVYVARRALARAALSFGDVLLGAFAAAAVVERLFGWPGAGALFIQAAALGNWPVVAALVFVIVAMRVLADFAGRLGSIALAGDAR